MVLNAGLGMDGASDGDGVEESGQCLAIDSCWVWRSQGKVPLQPRCSLEAEDASQPWSKAKMGSEGIRASLFSILVQNSAEQSQMFGYFTGT